MRNLIDAYARAVGAWASNVSGNALTRTTNALGKMSQGQYGTPEFTKDIYEYWRDLVDFRAQAALGIIPTAFLDIPAWVGFQVSNFVQAPAGQALVLTPVVNPETNTVLKGLELDPDNDDNSTRVKWVSANAGPAPGPGSRDKQGLFQGAICRSDNGELIATIHVRTRLP